MLKLDALIDKLILMICCLLIYLFQFDYAVSVVMVLIALIFSGFLSYFDDERLIFALTLGFIVLSYFSPEFVTFLPVIIYDSIFCRYRYVNLLAIIPLVHYLSLASDYIVVVSLVVLILGVLIRYRAEILYHLQGKQIQLNEMCIRDRVMVTPSRMPILMFSDFFTSAPIKAPKETPATEPIMAVKTT